MTDEEIEKGREWIRRLREMEKSSTPPPPLTIEFAVRRKPGQARERIEEERKATPAPLIKLSWEEVNAAVRAAEHKRNPRIESTVVQRADNFLPYPYAAFPEADPDLVAFRSVSANRMLTKSRPEFTAPVPTGGGWVGG